MNIRFLADTLFILLITSNTLFGYTPSEECKEIQCIFKPFIRKSKNIQAEHISQAKKNRLKKQKPQKTKTINPSDTSNMISYPCLPDSETALKSTKKTVFSLNWSGYVGLTDLDNPTRSSVNGVHGSWTVPSIIPSHKNKDTYSAIWVGIDGYNSPTVEQIGTEHDYVNGKKVHFAWFEMYPRKSFRIHGFPVNVGDIISASVKYLRKGIFELQIVNNTLKVKTTIPTQHTRLVGAQRKSANWIFEGPFSKRPLPLTNVGTVHLFNCTASINESGQRPIGNVFWPHVAIEMLAYTRATKTLPSALESDKKSFSITWLHH